jgi:Glycosyl hydrolases family 16/Calx-beta domain
MKNLLPLVVMALFCCCTPKQSPTPTPTVTPTISISSIAPFEGDVNANFSLKVSLSQATDKTVTVDFTTVDGTAGAGADYIAKTGTLTFSPQTTEKTIDITIVGDTLKEPDETFTIELSKPTNATIATSTGTATIRNDDTYIYVPVDGYITPETYTGYEKLFQDEFNGTQIDTTIWGYDIGGKGWGNNELQYYTNRPENAYLDNGKLVIQAKKESYNGSAYTSARLLTQNKRTFTFGRVDIRAKLPVAKGLWPALWGLGSKITQTGWPACGEMDIMELVGTNPNQVHGTFHWGTTPALHASYGTFTRLPTGDFSDKFHVFTMIWEADKAEIFMDDVSFFKFDKTKVGNAPYPFNEPLFLIMNVAVGGDWPGTPPATTTFPQQMLVDYVRVFKKI